MGDTGSLAIGGLLGTLAVVGKFEIYLAFLAGIFHDQNFDFLKHPGASGDDVHMTDGDRIKGSRITCFHF